MDGRNTYSFEFGQEGSIVAVFKKCPYRIQTDFNGL